MIQNPELDEESSEEWEKIKDFVGGANRKAKHPLQLEQERAKRRVPQHMEGGGTAGMSKDFPKLAQPPGTGVLVPGLGQAANQPPAVAPQTPPQQPAAPPAVATPPAAAPAQPAPPAAPTDAAYEGQANKIMGGVTPEMLQQLAQKFARPTAGQAVGMGVAGIGDAIASIGGREPGHMKQAEERFQKNRELQMGVPEKMAALGKEKFGLTETLQAKDPNSPYSKVIQNSERPNLKAIGWTDKQISKAPAVAVQDAVKNGLTYADTQAKYGLEKAIHEETIGLQKSQLENTKQYQKGQQDIERTNARLAHPVMSLIDNLRGGGGAKQYAPDVTAYAQKHGITPDQAQAIKNKRTGGQ
jgi:hypothetical protein